jgi:hypothetical protein
MAPDNGQAEVDARRRDGSVREDGDPDASRSVKPAFFLVGHPKCGTTALYHMLRRHPQVCIPVKEPGFFAQESMPWFSPRGHERPETELDYTDLFRSCPAGQVAGDATPWYLMSETAAHSIAEFQPAARIIAIFREPAAFIQSFHLHQYRWGIEDVRDLRRALALEASRVEGRHIPRRCRNPRDLWYSRHANYTDQLQRFRSVFPDDQMLVLMYEDFRRDNQATIRTVYRFLGVDDSLEIDGVEANPTVGVRSRALDRAIRRVTGDDEGAFSVVRRVVKRSSTKASRRWLRSMQARMLYKDPPPPDERVMAQLRSRLKPEVERFAAYLGRDLVTLWGYDAVA